MSVALTFDPHPRLVHNPEVDLELITSLEDRLNQIATLGVDATFVVPYTLELSRLSAHEFTQQYFVDALGAHEIVVGEDVRFGRDNEADVARLHRLGDEFGFDVVDIMDVESAGGRRWSSTWVRSLLRQGDVAGAAQILGRKHRVRGVVVHGHKRGRTLGIPTANLVSEGVGVVPADGVYVGWVVRDVPGTKAIEQLPAAISIGTNPQFGDCSRTVEAHVLGRSDLNLYGEQIAVDFVSRIRGMQTFSSTEEFLQRMDADLLEAARVLGVPATGRVDPDSVIAC